MKIKEGDHMARKSGKETPVDVFKYAINLAPSITAKSLVNLILLFSSAP